MSCATSRAGAHRSIPTASRWILFRVKAKATRSLRSSTGVYTASRPKRILRGDMKRTLLTAVIPACAAVEPGRIGREVPSCQVDPFWPRPLPNQWLLGSVTGVAVDSRDHVCAVHRGYDSMTARIAGDSKGNIFTTETYEGRRLQKFVYRGIGPVPCGQGTVWPTR